MIARKVQSIFANDMQERLKDAFKNFGHRHLASLVAKVATAAKDLQAKADRQRRTNRQTDRQTDRQTGRQTDRRTD